MSGRTAAFFDLDKTIISTSSSLALSRPFLESGLLSRSALVRSGYAQLGYLLLGAGHERTERMKDELARTATGWEVALLDAVVAEALATSIEPVVYREALDLIAEHHAAGRDVIIVSASAENIVRPIARLLGADHVVATRMAVADGRYTGEIDYYAYGPAKAEAVRDLAERHGYDLAESWAYSDSVTDLPMLEAVGHPVVVNPDRALRREAVARGWEARTFRLPVRLRPRHTIPLAVVVAVAVTAVAAWYLARRTAR